MKQVNWFERKFDFTVTNQNIMPAILERLAGTPLRMAFKVKFLRDDDCAIRMNNSWSIKEQIGHLSDLEPLWLGRIEDILSNREELRHADLENTKTTNANHNAKSLTQLVSDFEKSRSCFSSPIITAAVSSTSGYQEFSYSNAHPPERNFGL